MMRRRQERAAVRIVLLAQCLTDCDANCAQQAALKLNKGLGDAKAALTRLTQKRVLLLCLTVKTLVKAVVFGLMLEIVLHRYIDNFLSL